jgi:hypothetical protein
VAELLDLQAGVVARRQVVAAGLSDNDVRRMLRRREWVVVHPGVYVAHTGPLTWIQRAWAAVLAVAPAALCHASAMRAIDGKGGRYGEECPIHVAIARERDATAPRGVVLHRLGDFESKILANTSPPRQRPEHAVLDMAAEAANELDAIATLADAVRARVTTAAKMRTALDSRTRIRRRRFLAAVLDDIAAGTCSVLEHGYLTRVERAHGLPSASRQLHESAKGSVYRDVYYELFGFLVELDGRLGHVSVRDRGVDLDRDLDAALEDRQTVRLGWVQVFSRACITAPKLGALLNRRGWSESATPCPGCPPRDGA